jgi:GH15 family glucan-1,4-alpha-glucosidase
LSGLAIAEYALLSDCRSAALVSRGGSVDWLCVPRFDGPSVFGRLLDERAGHLWIRPVEEATVTRRYLDQTMVLETTFTTATGTLVLSTRWRWDATTAATAWAPARRARCCAAWPAPTATSRWRSATPLDPSTA